MLIGKRIDHYKELESTHLFAKSLNDNEIEDGMVILADAQTGGVGTHDRKWLAQANKNLTFNIILTPNCNIKKISNLTIIIAKCIVQTLYELYEIKTNIKKPNDIICNGKKMAGILTESVCIGEKVRKIFIGIGINVNQEEFPKELENIATSLKKEYKKEYSKEEILEKFLEIFGEEYSKILD